MTNNETIARLSTALETFKMVGDGQMKYPSVSVSFVDSIFIGGSNNGGEHYMYGGQNTERHDIACQPLVGLTGTQLVIYRVVGEERESATYGVYSHNTATCTALTIDEVPALFEQYAEDRQSVNLELATALIVEAAGKVSLVLSS